MIWGTSWWGAQIQSETAEEERHIVAILKLIADKQPETHCEGGGIRPMSEVAGEKGQILFKNTGLEGIEIRR